MQYEKNGVVRTFKLNANKIADYEEANPGYDLIKDLDGMDGLKFAVVRRIAGFIGLDYDLMEEYGLNFNDLTKIFGDCIKELGFTSDNPDSNTSSEKAA